MRKFKRALLLFLTYCVITLPSCGLGLLGVAMALHVALPLWLVVLVVGTFGMQQLILDVLVWSRLRQRSTVTLNVRQVNP